MTMVLAEGTDAPEISARDQTGELVSPDFENPTVLFFYPEDGTPGCSKEVEQFVLEQETYREAGVDVMGVSSDSVESHRDFAREHGVEFPLLSDPDGKIISDYGVEGDDGRARRTTVVILEGSIRDVYTSVGPDGHAREVLMDLLDDGVVELPGL